MHKLIAAAAISAVVGGSSYSLADETLKGQWQWHTEVSLHQLVVRGAIVVAVAVDAKGTRTYWLRNTTPAALWYCEEAPGGSGPKRLVAIGCAELLEPVPLNPQ